MTPGLPTYEKRMDRLVLFITDLQNAVLDGRSEFELR